MTKVPEQQTTHRQEDQWNVVTSELRWVTAVAFMLTLMIGVIIATSYTHMLHPPSSAQTTSTPTLHLRGEFVERNLGTEVQRDGNIVVRLVATRFSFVPECAPVLAGHPFTLRVASADVVHGLLVEGTNINTMVIPGDVAVVASRIDRPGAYRMPCHEYCGLGHSEMVGWIRALPPSEWHGGDPESRLTCAPDTSQTHTATAHPAIGGT